MGNDRNTQSNRRNSTVVNKNKMDVAGTIVFTTGIVIAFGSFFTQILQESKQRHSFKRQRLSQSKIVKNSLGASPMQVLVGGQIF